jgi:hypothetical protein
MLQAEICYFPIIFFGLAKVQRAKSTNVFGICHRQNDAAFSYTFSIIVGFTQGVMISHRFERIYLNTT